ncbi:MAG: cob(I)yrinic acid a,c-diamide adenosyltransferase [Pseudomonadota bacterium]
MGVYTRGGDEGSTGRLTGERISKADAVIEANGTVDELSAWLGVLRHCCGEEVLPGGGWGDVEALVIDVQKDLIRIGAAISSDDPRTWPIPLEKVPRFEALIDAVLAESGPLTRFLLPGLTETDARIHQARAVARRAERRVVALQPGDAADEAVQYLNRFADVLFALSVLHLHRAGLSGEGAC